MTRSASSGPTPPVLLDGPADGLRMLGQGGLALQRACIRRDLPGKRVGERGGPFLLSVVPRQRILQSPYPLTPRSAAANSP